MAIELDLAGKRVLITGASQGIGEGLAHAFAAEGARPHLVARSADRLAALAETLKREHGVEAGVTAADLGAIEGIERAVEEAGAIDILVNNAGAIPSGTLFDVDEAAWRKGWDLKVFGYVNMCRLVYPKLKAQGGGVIVNNIGNGGEVSDPAYIAGAAGNASLMAFTRALGGRSLDDGVRVVGVNPGPVDTDRIYSMLRKRAKALYGDDERYRELVKLYPRGRPARVRELTDLILFLASERAGYISGTIVTLDGGIASRQSIV
jgi:NAD(P)-dependent dehydrogenase (short-subunit alcohol dehydrogenase family)